MNKQEALNWLVVNVQDWDVEHYESPIGYCWGVRDCAEVVLYSLVGDWEVNKQDWLDAQPMSDSESVFIDRQTDEVDNATTNELFDPVKRL